MESITCRVCKEEKDISHFSKNKGYKNGRRNICRQCATDAHREWGRKNKDLKLEAQKRYYERYPEKLREKVYKRAHSQAYKLWVSLNKHIIKASSHKNSAKRKMADGSFSAQEWKSLCDKYDNKCLCCGKTDNKLTPDHVIPLSRGGTNYIENIQPLCLSCNVKKNAKTIDYRPPMKAVVK